MFCHFNSHECFGWFSCTTRPIKTPRTSVNAGPGPIFKPPGGVPGGDGSEFVCNYSAMKGFKECSTSEDRGCWLTDGLTTWDIYTDYEATTDETLPSPVNIMPTGTTRYYEMTATNAPINADGLSFPEGKQFQLASGDKSAPQYPGPWIQACWGDTINVTVHNNLQGNGTSVHWHGIRQWRTMHKDGVNGITQCPIAPRDSFTYTFKASQYGSSWYHSHYSIQYADGLVGPITIHGPHSSPYDVAPDIPILLTDWAHNSAFNALVGEMLDPGILLNGQGNITAFDSSVTPDDPSKAHPYVLKLNSGHNKRYLLRVINTSFKTTFVFSVDAHNMTVVETDFVPIYPYNATNITVGIGQRYDVILYAADDSDDSVAESYWIRTYIPSGCGIHSSETNYSRTGILWYTDSDSDEKTVADDVPTPTSTPWPNLDAEPCADEPYASITPVVPYFVQLPPSNNFSHGETQQIQDAQTNITNFTVGDLALNPITNAPDWIPLRIDFGAPSFLNLNESRPWAFNEVVIPEEFNSTVWVQLTITNFNGFGPHPIHLHGHDFAILNVTEGPLQPGEGIVINVSNPPRRDVVMVPLDGLVVIAFKADNPGSWLMHCHIAEHAAAGLGLQILERRKDALAIWPNATDSPAVKEAGRVCDNWRKWQDNCQNWAVPCTEIFQDDSGV
ncbi:multicopper oxidase-domain-containing protein [Apodospora peruviana]|uniref:Multicopper oxidase-domain-containing protein n=1 Tax=Apodospora peruviana TaxID=516989 RepID=A0AAE0M2J3_9PEZI|nr:multicopper oxidase-domain-containing protein [Apodospora peruviana]